MFSSQAGARPRTWEASPSEHKKWVEVFRACDEDNKGYLSREDFKVAVVMLFGYKPSKIEADSVMSSGDPNTSGIQLKEFLDIVRKKKEAQLYRNEVRHIFTAFDRHYRGYLTLEDFKKAFKQVAPKLSERIILEVFSENKTIAESKLEDISINRCISRDMKGSRSRLRWSCQLQRLRICHELWTKASLIMVYCLYATSGETRIDGDVKRCQIAP
uniref:EF-hand calcium binding domain 11 n=1 Tax=Capra hircus TaxID=9925 RepID=A0A8C2P3A9_CAPHI